jgi:hypothetical protein
MPGPIDPIQRANAARRAHRQARGAEVERDAEEVSNLPVPIGDVSEPPPPEPTRTAAAAYAAQLLGQTGQRRGLKGGAPVLDSARSAYLGTEWSGAADRRGPKGKVTKTQI